MEEEKAKFRPNIDPLTGIPRKEADRETVGAFSYKLAQEKPVERSPIELQREAQKNYLSELLTAVDRGKKIYEGDFFIHVETKMEHLMKNVTRNYFIVRSTCPTPFFDQSVFKYSKKDEQLQYIWTIPSQDACIHLKQNMMQVDKSETELLYMVLKYYDGTLLHLAKQLNGETSDLDVIITKKEENQEYAIIT